MNTQLQTASIATIVLDHPETARVFQENRLDFCCKGDRTVAQACAERKADPAVVFAALEQAIAERAGVPADADARDLATPALIARIVDRHHGYLRRALPFLAPLANKVARVHGDHEPRLIEVNETFRELKDALEPHLEQEEQVLFPALSTRTPDLPLIRQELEGMHEEHLQVGAMLEKIRTLCDDFQVPTWGCNSYRTLFAELRSLEADILHHVHLENHVLRPRFA